MVRDPIERMLSHYLHNVGGGYESRPMAEALADPDSAYVARSRYAMQLEPYLAAFDRERVLVVANEELAGERDATLRGVFEFCGVDAGFRSEQFEREWETGSGKQDGGFRLMDRAVRLPGLRAIDRNFDRLPESLRWLVERVVHDPGSGPAPKPRAAAAAAGDAGRAARATTSPSSSGSRAAASAGYRIGPRVSEGQRRREMRAVKSLRRSLFVCLVVAAALPAAGAAKAKPTPVIFVHGTSGSAQQFETDAMRFTSNGFPQGRLFAYEYDTSGSSNDAAIANLDGFIASVKARDRRRAGRRARALARDDRDAHVPRRTPERAASVRRYVNFDGRTSRLAARRRADAGDLGRGRPGTRDRRRRERLLPEQGAHRGDHLARVVRRRLRVPRSAPSPRHATCCRRSRAR